MNAASCIVSIIALSEFVASASGITNGFIYFEKELLTFGPKIFYELDSMNNLYWIKYHQFMNFVNRNKLHVRLIGASISTQNVITFIIAFAVGKIISYSLYNFS